MSVKFRIPKTENHELLMGIKIVGFRQVFAMICLLNACIYLSAQTPIFLLNPSFEDNPRYGKVPGGWQNCAFNEESPPDIHPVKGGSFGVDIPAKEGETYLGIVVRENKTSEGVGQHLETAIHAGTCYAFSLQLCRSDTLISLSRMTNQRVNYNTPAVLRIWGGISPCGKKMLLAESPPVENTDWVKYNFQFSPMDSVTYLSFEAYFAKDAAAAYNGNLLIDNASPLVPIDCGTKKPLVDMETVEIPTYSVQKIPLDLERQEVRHSSDNGSKIGQISNFRVASNIAELEGIIEDNCGMIAFKPGETQIEVFRRNGFREVAYNVKQITTSHLIVGVSDAGKRFNKLRMRHLQSLLRKMGLKKDRYSIFTLGPGASRAGFRCGAGDIWLKVEAR